jgi:hypothetical protein
LEGLTFAVNKNMQEIVDPLEDATAEFIARLGSFYLPNLRIIDTGYVSASRVKALVMHFPNLEYLIIRIQPLRRILELINDYCDNLTHVSLDGCKDWSEDFIRENLTNRQGLMVQWGEHEIKIKIVQKTASTTEKKLNMF